MTTLACSWLQVNVWTNPRRPNHLTYTININEWFLFVNLNSVTLLISVEKHVPLNSHSSAKGRGERIEERGHTRMGRVCSVTIIFSPHRRFFADRTDSRLGPHITYEPLGRGLALADWLRLMSNVVVRRWDSVLPRELDSGCLYILQTQRNLPSYFLLPKGAKKRVDPQNIERI